MIAELANGGWGRGSQPKVGSSFKRLNEFNRITGLLQNGKSLEKTGTIFRLRLMSAD